MGAGSSFRIVVFRCCLLAFCLVTKAERPAIHSVSDLQRAIYTQMPFLSNTQEGGDACVRLLNATGTVGCAAAAAVLEGRLVRLQALLPQPESYPTDAVFLLPPALLADFLGQCRASSALLHSMRGVLVEPGPLPPYSQAEAAPLADWALYEQRWYPWNPAGRGLISLDLPFPVLLLDEAAAANAVRRAADNELRGHHGAQHTARIQMPMDAAGNSSACLAAGTCLPLGGHSVLATLPPLSPPAARAAGGPDQLPALWILSQVDSTALFHEAAVGADAAVSGLIAMLVTADLLGAHARRGGGGADGTLALPRYRRRLVFAALGGEPWGLMGSKRLLWELHSGNASLAGLSLAADDVAGVLEVTQVGHTRGGNQPGSNRSSPAAQFYTHAPRTPQPGNGTAELLLALQAAAAASSAQAPGGVALSPAAATTPGLPPTASAASFLRVAPDLPTVVLAGFNEAFQGGAFQSQYDGMPTVDADSITAATLVLARAAASLAFEPAAGAGEQGQAGGTDLPLDYSAVRVKVEALMQCLLNASVGLNCPAAAALMTPVRGGHVAHYIGVLRTLTADAQLPDASVKSDTERFLWNYLAFATATNSPAANGTSSSRSNSQRGSMGGSAAGPLQNCQPLNLSSCPAGLVCAGSRSIKGKEGLGVCLEATARYVPSYSTSLLCDGCDGARTLWERRWRLSDVARQWERQHSWPPDPLWSESNWPQGTPALTLYLKEAPGVEEALLAAGAMAAAASVLGALALRAAHARKLKRR